MAVGGGDIIFVFGPVVTFIGAMFILVSLLGPTPMAGHELMTLTPLNQSSKVTFGFRGERGRYSSISNNY